MRNTVLTLFVDRANMGSMEVRFDDPSLDRLEVDAGFTKGMDAAIVKAFRKRMQMIRSAVDERDLYSVKSLRFEKLKGKRSRERSMRLNDQWRLILEIQGDAPSKVVVVKGIEDYH